MIVAIGEERAHAHNEVERMGTEGNEVFSEGRVMVDESEDGSAAPPSGGTAAAAIATSLLDTAGVWSISAPADAVWDVSQDKDESLSAEAQDLMMSLQQLEKTQVADAIGEVVSVKDDLKGTLQEEEHESVSRDDTNNVAKQDTDGESLGAQKERLSTRLSTAVKCTEDLVATKRVPLEEDNSSLHAQKNRWSANLQASVTGVDVIPIEIVPLEDDQMDLNTQKERTSNVAGQPVVSNQIPPDEISLQAQKRRWATRPSSATAVPGHPVVSTQVPPKADSLLAQKNQWSTRPSTATPMAEEGVTDNPISLEEERESLGAQRVLQFGSDNDSPMDERVELEREQMFTSETHYRPTSNFEVEMEVEGKSEQGPNPAKIFGSDGHSNRDGPTDSETETETDAPSSYANDERSEMDSAEFRRSETSISQEETASLQASSHQSSTRSIAVTNSSSHFPSEPGAFLMAIAQPPRRARDSYRISSTNHSRQRSRRGDNHMRLSRGQSFASSVAASVDDEDLDPDDESVGDGGLVEARLVEEGEELPDEETGSRRAEQPLPPKDLVEAEPLDETQTKKLKFLSCTLLGITVLVIVGAAIFGILFFAGVVLDDGGDSDDAPSQAPTTSPSIVPTVSHAPSAAVTLSVRDHLFSIVPQFSRENIQVLMSPAYMSYSLVDSLVGEESDIVMVKPADQTLIDVFGTMTVYYATNGHDWADFNPGQGNIFELCEYPFMVCDATGESFVEARLTGLGLDGPLPPEIGVIMNLERLEAAHNSLEGNLPSEIGFLTNLRHLDLSHNELDGTIPVSLPTQATALETVLLNNNQFSGELADEWSLLNPEVLQLHSNNLRGTIPDSWSAMTRLRQLTLYDNSLLSGSVPDGVCDLVRTGNLNLTLDCAAVTCTCGCNCVAH